MTEVDEIVGIVRVVERLLDIVEDEMIIVDEILPEGIEEGIIVVDEAMLEDEDEMVVFPGVYWRLSANRLMYAPSPPQYSWKLPLQRYWQYVSATFTSGALVPHQPIKYIKSAK